MTNFSILFNSFYKDLKIDFNEIDLKKLLEIKLKSKQLNKYYENEFDKKDKARRYSKVMELIHTNHMRRTNNINCLSNFAITNTQSEKILLYMLSIDPELNALIIYGTCNKTQDVKEQIKAKFGVYDPNLIKIEKQYLKRFLSEEKKDQMKDEIIKRVFK